MLIGVLAGVLVAIIIVIIIIIVVVCRKRYLSFVVYIFLRNTYLQNEMSANFTMAHNDRK